MRKYGSCLSAVAIQNAAVVAAVVGIMATPLAWAEELPCPVDQVISETREHNQKQGRGLPESFYQELAQNYMGQCEYARKTIAELSPKLEEYEKGNRDDRDGYIILQKLYNQYEVIRAASTPAALSVKEKLSALVKKHPAFPGMKDSRLSEELNRAGQIASQQTELAKQARKWTPPDSSPVTVFGSDKHLIARYQYRLEFFTLPPDSTIEPGRQLSKVVRHLPNGVQELIALGSLKPQTVLRFKHAIDVLPRIMDKSPESNLLVCTNPLAWYSATNEEELKMVHAQGHPHGTPWVDTAAKLEDFCGIVSQTGIILYKFPVSQSLPNKLIAPIGIADNGQRAAIGIGEKVVESDDDGSRDIIGNVREVLIWESPNQLRHVKSLPPHENLNDLLNLFLQKKL